MKILNFGSCNIDFVYSVENIVVPGETLSSNKLDLFAGGKGLNQSIAAARAGAVVYHAGCIGSDGEMLKDVLCESGVNTDYLYTVKGKNGHAVIQVSSQGENSIVLYPGSNFMVTKELVDKVLQNFGKDDILLLQNEISNVPYIISKAYEKGMKIAFNPAPFDEKLKAIDFNKLTYLILNETEAMGFTGKKEPMDSIAYIKDKYPLLTVILTVGKEGCICSYADKILKQSAYKVNVVDTTAAGDTFTGYFLSCVCKGMSIEKALKISSAASAVTVSGMGAAPSIPTMNKVDAAIKEMKEYTNSTLNKSAVIYKYIDENLKTANLNELSRIFGYTKEYTSELVKRKIGVSFSCAVKKKRCERAAELLKSTDMSISEIIEEVGYSNETFFRENFKELYSFSPLKYRKEKQK